MQAIPYSTNDCLTASRNQGAGYRQKQPRSPQKLLLWSPAFCSNLGDLPQQGELFCASPGQIPNRSSVLSFIQERPRALSRKPSVHIHVEQQERLPGVLAPAAKMQLLLFNGLHASRFQPPLILAFHLLIRSLKNSVSAQKFSVMRTDATSIDSVNRRAFKTCGSNAAGSSKNQ